jgi:hypothetical protein
VLCTPTPQVELCLAASKLDNKDTWGKSDPFLRISKARESGEWAPVLKTEVRWAGSTAARGPEGVPDWPGRL